MNHREWNRWCIAREWGDGLPTFAPTEDLVAEMTAGHTEVDLGPFPPRGVTPTIAAIAANAVMAGCSPADLPVVLAALRAVQAKQFNLHGVLATTHPCSVMIMVGGPVVPELGLTGSTGCFGPGNWAAAAISRAVNLVLRNVGGAVPGGLDMATHGSPAKYQFCFAENENESPWEPYRVRRGHAPEVSTVTVMAAESPHNINDHASGRPEDLVMTIAGTVVKAGSNNLHNGGPHVLVLGPEHAQTVAATGWTVSDVQHAVWDAARLPADRVAEPNRRRFAAMGVSPAHGSYPIGGAPEDLHVVVAGGAGKHSAWIPSFGATALVTRPVQQPARSESPV